MEELSNHADDDRFDAEKGPAKLSNPDDLYVFRVRNGPFKVGRSSNVAARLRTIQSGSPYPVTCLLTVQGAGWQEPIWHRALADYRIRGEWFDYYPEMDELFRRASLELDWWEVLDPPLDYLTIDPDAAYDRDEVGEIIDEWNREMAAQLSLSP